MALTPTHGPTEKRSYGISGGCRIFLGSCGAALVVGGILGTYFGAGYPAPTVAGRMVLVIGPPCFAVLGGYLLVFVVTSRLNLSPEGIEARDFFHSKTLLRKDIAGWRRIPTQYLATLVFVSKNPSGKKLSFPDCFKTDAVFSAWLDGLPNLDQRDFEQASGRLETLARGSDSPREGAERIERARANSKILNWASGLAGVWGWLYPQPYVLVVGILIAITVTAISLALRGNGIYDLEGKRNEPRPSLAIPLIFPGAVLALRALWDVNVLDWKSLLVATLAVSLGLSLLTVRAERNGRGMTRAFLLLSFLLMGFSFGAITEINWLLDRSQPAVMETEVLGRRIYNGRRSTTYYLVLGPWGPRAAPKEVTVPINVYRAESKGDTVVVRLYQGALHIAWYTVSPKPR